MSNFPPAPIELPGCEVSGCPAEAEILEIVDKRKKCLGYQLSYAGELFQMGDGHRYLLGLGHVLPVYKLTDIGERSSIP